MKKYLEENQKLWDEWASFHPDSKFYDMESFLNGQTTLKEIEMGALGDVKGKRLLHLQCHFGQDTLSWSRLGAKTTGVDFSATAIETARQLNRQLGLDALFIQSDIQSLKGKLEGQYDIVFTSYGVLTWLPGLQPWAEVIRHYLKPGGVFLLVEFHPAFMMFDLESGHPAYSYFYEEAPLETEINGHSYAGKYEAGASHKEYTWQHNLSDITMALLDAGLALKEFREYDFSPYNCWPEMEEIAPDRFRSKKLPGAPHLFSLRMEG